MLSKIISFGAVFIYIAWGGNTRTFNFTSPCPLTIAPHVACTTSIDWVGDQFNNEQCRAAIQRLFNAEVSVHGGTEFEFLSAGAIPFTSNPVMRTPRKYIVGQSHSDVVGVILGADEEPSGRCTLAIVMLEFFPPGSLPGQDPWGPRDYPDTDVASFQDLWLASDLIETCCLQSRRSPGWALAGEAFLCIVCCFPELIISRIA